MNIPCNCIEFCQFSKTITPQAYITRIRSYLKSINQSIYLYCNFPSDNFTKVRLGPPRRHRLKRGPSAPTRMGYGAERCLQNRQVAEGCGKDVLWKLPLWKLHVLKVAIWENTLGKLPQGKYLALIYHTFNLLLTSILETKSPSPNISAVIHPSTVPSHTISPNLGHQSINQSEYW